MIVSQIENVMCVCVFLYSHLFDCWLSHTHTHKCSKSDCHYQIKNDNHHGNHFVIIASILKKIKLNRVFCLNFYNRVKISKMIFTVLFPTMILMLISCIEIEQIFITNNGIHINLLIDNNKYLKFDLQKKFCHGHT